MPGSLGQLGQAGAGGVGATAQGSLPGWANILLPSLFGVGTAGNIIGDVQKMKEQSWLSNYQKQLAGMSPQQLSSMVNQATQPLSQGLTQNVGNSVQASLAQRGLAQAPGIYAGELSQSLAPYYQQNQQQALQAVMAKLGLPLQATPPANLYSSGGDMSNLLMAWLRNIGGGGSQSNLNGLALPINTSAFGGPTGGPAGLLGATSGSSGLDQFGSDINGGFGE